MWDGRECLDSFWIKVLEKTSRLWTEALDRAVLAQVCKGTVTEMMPGVKTSHRRRARTKHVLFW